MNRDSFISIDLFLNLLSFLFLYVFRQNVTPQLEQLRRDVNLLLGRYDDRL